MAELRERNQRLMHSTSQIERLNEQLGRKIRDRDAELSVVENVTLPLRFSSRRRERASDPKTEAKRLLAHLGMEELLHRPV